MDIQDKIKQMKATATTPKENTNDDRERCNSCNGYIDAIGRCRCFKD